MEKKEGKKMEEWGEYCRKNEGKTKRRRGKNEGKNEKRNEGKNRGIIIIVILTKKVPKFICCRVCVSIFFEFSFTAAAPCDHHSLNCGGTNHAAEMKK